MLEKSFLSELAIRNPEFFLDLISVNYAFTEEELELYCNMIKWPYISRNEKVLWNKSILKKHKHQLDWSGICNNHSIPWDDELISEFRPLLERKMYRIICDDDSIKYTSQLVHTPDIKWTRKTIERNFEWLDFDVLSRNEGIDWSDGVLEYFDEHWNWESLTANHSIPLTLDIYEKYYDCWSRDFLTQIEINDAFNSSIEIIEKYPESVRWNIISKNSKLPWKEMNLLERWKDWINWDSLAANTSFVFSEETFYTYLPKWQDSHIAWASLSQNPALPWSPFFINPHKNNWNWANLALNPGIDWDIDKMEQFRTFVTENPIQFIEGKAYTTTNNFGSRLSENPNVSWSAELLLKFWNILDREQLVWNKGVWEKALKDYLDQETLEKILKVIL